MNISQVKTQQDNSLCLAVNPPPFDKGGKGVGGLLHFAKPAKRSLKGKGVGAERGIVRIWKGWCEAKDGGMAIPPVVARIFSGDSTSPLTREASVVVRGKG